MTRVEIHSRFAGHPAKIVILQYTGVWIFFAKGQVPENGRRYHVLGIQQVAFHSKLKVNHGKQYFFSLSQGFY
jgi:hypothetical protein